MILSDEETEVLQTLIEEGGKLRNYGEAKSLMVRWRGNCWTKAALRRALNALEDKRLVRRQRHVSLAVTEAGIAVLKSI